MVPANFHLLRSRLRSFTSRPIEGIIDLGLAPFVQRVLKEAANANASAVILEINTFGGRVGQSCSAKADQQSADAGVVSNSEFIESKAPIIVTRVDGNRIVVRRHRAATERGDK